MPHRLFAYGTLMIPEVFERVTGRPAPASPATLLGFVRRRVRGACYPGLRPEPGGRVEGTLYEALDTALVDALDRFEGSLYERRTLRVETVRGPRRAFVYAVPLRRQNALEASGWDPDEFRRLHLREFLGNDPGGRAHPEDDHGGVR